MMPLFNPLPCVLPFFVPCSALMVHILHCAFTVGLTAKDATRIKRRKIIRFNIGTNININAKASFKIYVIKKPPENSGGLKYFNFQLHVIRRYHQINDNTCNRNIQPHRVSDASYFFMPFET